MSYVHALRICLLKQVLFQVNFPHTKIFPFKELRKSQELGLKGFLHMIIKTWTKHTRIDTWLCTQTHACVWIHIQIHAHLYTCVHTDMWLWSGSFHYQTSSNPTPLTAPTQPSAPPAVPPVSSLPTRPSGVGGCLEPPRQHHPGHVTVFISDRPYPRSLLFYQLSKYPQLFIWALET